MNADATAKLIARLHAESWRAAYAHIYPRQFLEHGLDADRLTHWQARVRGLKAGEGEVFLARAGGEAAGFLCLEKVSGQCFVDNLHVLPRFQRMGIANRLVDEASVWARAHRCAGLYLYVLEQNPKAQQYYLRTGWRETGREMDELPGGVGELLVLRMEKSLS